MPKTLNLNSIYKHTALNTSFFAGCPQQMPAMSISVHTKALLAQRNIPTYHFHKEEGAEEFDSILKYTLHVQQTRCRVNRCLIYVTLGYLAPNIPQRLVGNDSRKNTIPTTRTAEVISGNLMAERRCLPPLLRMWYPCLNSVKENVDPEEAFVASLSSCQMLLFLSIAAKMKFVIDQYVDHASGLMSLDSEGRIAMTKVTLKPSIKFAGDKQPTPVQLEKMHRQSHQPCFIANSVKTAVLTEIL